MSTAVRTARSTACMRMRYLMPLAMAMAGTMARTARAQDSAVPRAPLARPDVVRGLYVKRWAVLDQRVWNLIGVAEHTEVNALVLDVKDIAGMSCTGQGCHLHAQSVRTPRRLSRKQVHPRGAASPHSHGE